MTQVFTDGHELGANKQHEYDIVKIENIISLRSVGSGYQNRGEIVLKVKDTGDDYIFKLEKFKLRLDYAQAQQLYILLGYLNDENIEIRESEVIKSL